MVVRPFHTLLKTISAVVLAWSLSYPARADLTSPVVAQTLPAPVLAKGGSVDSINLYNYLNDPNVPGTAVRINVQAGTLVTGKVDLALFDSQTPITVANFLADINNGLVTENIIHRSANTSFHRRTNWRSFRRFPPFKMSRVFPMSAARLRWPRSAAT